MITGAFGGKEIDKISRIMMSLIFESAYATTNVGNDIRPYPFMGNCIELCRTLVVYLQTRARSKSTMADL